MIVFLVVTPLHTYAHFPPHNYAHMTFTENIQMDLTASQKYQQQYEHDGYDVCGPGMEMYT
jgi:hypothetical protein